MKAKFFNVIPMVFTTIIILLAPHAMAETGMPLPVIGEGEGFLESGKTVQVHAKFVVTSARTMGEMGAYLPVIKEGEGILETGKTSSGTGPVITSARTMGEMGAALPVIEKGAGDVKSGKAMAQADPAVSPGKTLAKKDKSAGSQQSAVSSRQ